MTTHTYLLLSYDGDETVASKLFLHSDLDSEALNEYALEKANTYCKAAEHYLVALIRLGVTPPLEHEEVAIHISDGNYRSSFVSFDSRIEVM